MKYFTLYMCIVVIARIFYLLGLTVNNQVGWLSMQFLLTIGQFLLLGVFFDSFKYLKIPLLLALGFVSLLWIWNSDQTWYQRVIQLNGYKLIFMASCFLFLFWVKQDLFRLGCLVYFSGLATASFFGENGLLFNKFSFSRANLDLSFSSWIILSNLIWLNYFRGSKCTTTNHTKS